MSLRKIVFTDSTMAARDLGAALASVLADGAVSGCAVTYAGNTIGIASGFLSAAGRLIENTSAMSISLTGTGVAQIVLQIDASGSGTVSVVTRTATSEAALPALTQQDINDGSSTTYEMELALVDRDTDSLVRSMGRSGRPIYVVNAAPTAGARDGIYFVTARS